MEENMNYLFSLNPSIDDKDIYILGNNSVSLLLFSVLLQNNVYVKGFVSSTREDDNVKIMNKPIVDVAFLEHAKNEIAIVAAGEDMLNKAKEMHSKGFQVYFDYNYTAYMGDCVLIDGDEE